MTNEQFFRMLSVAVLGLGALAAVPDSGASDAPPSIAAVAPVEVVAVTEVNEINAGHFDPIQAALTASETAPIVIASPVKTTTVTAFDPNL